jgi:sulfate adenylyltransferase subunit 1 (EFTu-like GTPase family)
MDTVGYREERFNMIRDELEGFIEAIGFRRSDVYFVPTSAYNTDNLVSTSKRMPWYNGEPLLGLLYGNAKKGDAAGRGKELRAVLQGFIDESRTMIAGRVVSGRMRVGDRVCVLPPGLESTVKEIVVKGRRARAAGIGESVAFRLGEKVKSEVRGGALAPAAAHPPLSEVAMVRIFLTRSDLSKPMIKFNGEEVGCKSVKVLRVIDTRSGREKAGKWFKSLDAIEAELTVRRSLPFESYGKTRALGRFVLYSGNRFAGIGTVS